MTLNAWDTPDLTQDGQLLIGNSAGRPKAGTITSLSSNAIVTNAGGAITISTPTTNGDWIKISSTTASTSATIDFTGLSNTYNIYKVIITNLIPVTDNVGLYLRTSTDNGATFDSGASDYQYQGISITTSGLFSSVNNSASLISLTTFFGNAGNEAGSLELSIYNPSNSEYTKMISEGGFLSPTTTRRSFQVGASRQSVIAIDAIRFYLSSGNIKYGNFILYGLTT